ncbi:unnamed protein product [Trichogramma brassicae]|uniref:Uncharacterized protein n=1 Tax=Trichogramma brassicae TaxID=86971 RepID=A0A6H5I4M3_9HYME|nr:unnamed protein product [Trichogramma brassicae]
MFARATGIIGEKFPRGEATNAVAPQLAADDRAGPARGPALVPAAAHRGLPPRHTGLDVLQHDLLDAVRALRRPLELCV